MILLQTSDFTGFQSLAKNTFDTPKIQAYIDRYEKELIIQLLGANLGQAFIDDLANVSQDPKYSVIEDEFYFDYNGSIYHSKGMRDMLVSMIFYYYCKDQAVKHTTAGAAKAAVEGASVKSDFDQVRFGEKKWNDALDTVDAIQWYVTVYAPILYADDASMRYDDPAFNGQEFKPVFSAIL